MLIDSIDSDFVPPVSQSAERDNAGQSSSTSEQMVRPSAQYPREWTNCQRQFTAQRANRGKERQGLLPPIGPIGTYHCQCSLGWHGLIRTRMTGQKSPRVISPWRCWRTPPSYSCQPSPPRSLTLNAGGSGMPSWSLMLVSPGVLVWTHSLRRNLSDPTSKPPMPNW